jgi:drug/metabolite transporter (DMT)-like permease
MIAALLGLLVAMGFGSGDFAGGRASVSASAVAVLVVSQACAVIGALVVALLVSARVGGDDIVLGVLAGSFNVVGLGLLYRGLAQSAAGVVAPIAAVVGAVVPVVWGLTQDERPSGLVLAGVTLAIVAGGLIAREPGPATGTRLAQGSAQAAVAGLALGSSLVLYSETSDASGMWPVFAARVAALVLVGVAATWLAFTATVRFPAGSARVLAVSAGLFDVAATALLVVAVRRELVSVVAPIASLAPAFTVLLAWIVLRERLRVDQRVGLLVALAGLVLVAAG